jgi:hypothetical protein
MWWFAIEHTIIPLPPKNPSFQYNRRVELFLELLSHDVDTIRSPVIEDHTDCCGQRAARPILWRRKNQLKTQFTTIWLIVSSSCSQRGQQLDWGIFLLDNRSDVPIVDHKPDEENALKRSPSLPDTMKSLPLQVSLEDGCISWGCWIFFGTRQPPKVSIRHVGLQVNPFKSFPKKRDFHEHLPGWNT